MTNYSVFKKLNIKVKFIYIYRSPVELVYSWIKRGLDTRWGKDPRLFTLIIKKKNKNYHSYSAAMLGTLIICRKFGKIK